MMVSEGYFEGLKIPYSLWVCGFDSRPRHQFIELADANQLSIANLLLTRSFHGYPERDPLAGEQFTSPPHFFFLGAVPISLKFSGEKMGICRRRGESTGQT